MQYDWHQISDKRGTVFTTDDIGQKLEEIAATTDPLWAEKIAIALNLEAKIRQEIEITSGSLRG
jgi:hypothetical protein